LLDGDKIAALLASFVGEELRHAMIQGGGDGDDESTKMAVVSMLEG